MAYNEKLPADTTAPTEIRENFRALKEDKIVAADSANTADKLSTARSISLTGDITGSADFDGSTNSSIETTIVGNAPSATKLQTGRKINGVEFDGTKDITITAAAEGGNADTVDGKHASDFASAGYMPPNATETSSGSMSAADKTKLDGIAVGAEVNQNAFSNVLVGEINIQANSEADTLKLVAGDNIVLTPDAVNDSVTIAVNGKVVSSASADTAAVCTGNAATATYSTSARNADTVDELHAFQFVRTDASSTISGDNKLILGPNSNWGSYLRVGGNGSTDQEMATVVTTNGNLHLDAKSGNDTYINHYSGGKINFGLGIKSFIDTDGIYNGTATYAISAGNADTLDGHHWNEIELANYDAAHSFGTNGYQKLGNGLIIQWGTITSEASSTPATYSFPIPFPNAVFGITLTQSALFDGAEANAMAYPINTSQFKAYIGRIAVPGFYVAIGC